VLAIRHRDAGGCLPDPRIGLRDPASRFNNSLHHILGIACLEEKFGFALSCGADVTSGLGPLDVTTSAINGFAVLDPR
jgi:hypothetical protein